VVACGEKLLEEGDVLLNPTVIVEVLSPSTEDYDRGVKFDHYRKIESLTDYLLVRQDSHHVEHRDRQPDGQWTSETLQRLDDVVKLSAISCELPLTEVYRRVTINA
jgi:Uma2 family endonuclease